MAVVFKRKPRAQVEAHRLAYDKARALPAPSTVVQANVDQILDLGDTVYVTFRGSPFGVPPVGWRLGERLLALRFDAVGAAGTGTLTQETTPQFYQALGRLADAIWNHLRPVGKIRRVFKRLGILRNPLKTATEKEIVDFTDFFLERRMVSSIGFLKDHHHGSSIG